ncbi:hypothetical protein N7470_009639 [Penicillium chermesinum]|nr:hypothetical protein N7470_009639 [Penicillium chermesinum]
MSFVRPIAQIVHLKPSAVAAYKDADFEGPMEKKKKHANPKLREWWAMTDGMQSSTNESAAKENPIPGAAGSADGPGW